MLYTRQDNVMTDIKSPSEFNRKSIVNSENKLYESSKQYESKGDFWESIIPTMLKFVTIQITNLI